MAFGISFRFVEFDAQYAGRVGLAKRRAGHSSEQTTGSEPILLKTEMGAGHGGPSGRYDAWRDEALVLAFLLDAFGLGTRDVRATPGESAALPG